MSLATLQRSRARRCGSCDALELIIVPRTRDLGDGFEVRRALPHGKRQMVGPFIFFDHFGPMQFIAGKGMDVRPHPHIGLATVTYLFDGSIMQRDSEGQHSGNPARRHEPDDRRPRHRPLRTFRPTCSGATGRRCSVCKAGSRCRRVPKEIAPSFQHYAAESLPTVKDKRLHRTHHRRQFVRRESPVTMVSPWFYTEVTATAGTSVPLGPRP